MKHSLLSVALCCIGLALLPACRNQDSAAIENTSPSALVGDWTLPRSESTPTATIQFKEDSRFIVTLDGQPTPESEGSYSVTGNELILQNEGITASGDCTLSATYTFTIDGDTVKFERIQDDLCAARVDQFNKIWTRK
jgi:hypothetical protein